MQKLKKDGSREVFQYDGMDKPKELLEQIKTACKEIAIGYTKENRQIFEK